MRCLIRHITHHSKGGSVYQDKTFNGKNLRIGRAADQHVFLADQRVALQHAVITDLLDGRFLVQSKSLSGIRVNDRLVQSFTLKIGDRIGIGQSELRLIEPPPRYDLALEVIPRRAEGDHLPHALPAVIGLGAAGWRMRRWSWLLFCGGLLLFLALPAGQVYLRGHYQPLLERLDAWLVGLNAPAADPAAGFDEFEDFSDTSLLPAWPTLLSDRFWNSGELASAHHFFRQECDTCHQAAFERVPDRACTNCHQKTHPHVDPEFFDLERLKNTRCAECHHEHNGKHALIERDDSLCGECHRDLSLQGVNTELRDVSDFGDHHPEFKPTLLRDGDDGEAVRQRVAMDAAEGFEEQSNLEFSHATHVSHEGLSTLDGVFRLWCEDCHLHRSGNAGLEPVDYQKHCHQCHPLLFEPSDQEREVPHGKVSEVIYTLREYYGNLALEGGFSDFDAPEVVSAPRPGGAELSDADRLLALDWARRKADEMGQEVFEFSVCIECHKVRQIQANPPRWDVLPVLLSKPWLPKARFTHEKHKTMDCLFCHAAPESSVSGDILIPDLSACRQCHGGSHAEEKLQSTCVDCHGFHIADQFSMRKPR